MSVGIYLFTGPWDMQSIGSWFVFGNRGGFFSAQQHCYSYFCAYRTMSDFSQTYSYFNCNEMTQKKHLYLHFECNVKLKHNPLYLPGMPAYHYHHRIVFGIRYISFQTHIVFQVKSYWFFRVIISASIFIHKKYTYIYLFITST